MEEFISGKPLSDLVRNLRGNHAYTPEIPSAKDAESSMKLANWVLWDISNLLAGMVEKEHPKDASLETPHTFAQLRKYFAETLSSYPEARKDEYEALIKNGEAVVHLNQTLLPNYQNDLWGMFMASVIDGKGPDAKTSHLTGEIAKSLQMVNNLATQYPDLDLRDLHAITFLNLMQVFSKNANGPKTFYQEIGEGIANGHYQSLVEEEKKKATNPGGHSAEPAAKKAAEERLKSLCKTHGYSEDLIKKGVGVA